METPSQAVEIIICEITDTTKPNTGKQITDFTKKYPATEDLHQSTNGGTPVVLSANMVNNYSWFFTDLS